MILYIIYCTVSSRGAQELFILLHCVASIGLWGDDRAKLPLPVHERELVIGEELIGDALRTRYSARARARSSVKQHARA